MHVASSTGTRTGRSPRRIAARVAHALLLAASVPLGIAAAAVVLVAVVSATGSRVAGMTAGVLALVACTGGVSARAALSLAATRSVRRALPAAVTGVTLVVVAAVAWVLLLAPAPPATPATATDDTRYWDLPTGSRIAHTRTEAQGDPRPTPVILVHGGPGGPDRRQEQLTATLAAAGFDVYDYHQIGSGLSGRARDVREYTVARHVADLEAIRTRIGADRVVLVGTSWGGQLIASYMAAHPQRVARAVVSSPGTIWSPAYPHGSLTAEGERDQQAVVRELPRLLLAHVLVAAAGPRTAHALLPDQQVDGVLAAVVDRIDMRAGCDGRQHSAGSDDSPVGMGFWVNLMTTRDAVRVADPRPALRDVAAPVLVLRGECDYIAWEVAREYRDVLPNAVLLAVDDAGHAIQEDQPRLYREAVLAFLTGGELPLQSYDGMSAPASFTRDNAEA